MKQVIKHGHARYRITCPFCECIFTFEDEDIENNGCQWDYEEWIDCPECGKRIHIQNRKEYQFHTS